MRARIGLTSLACALVLAAPAHAALRATLPAGWSRAGWRLTALTVPAEVYGAASFPLHRTPPGACGPSDALRAQMPQNGVIVIVESWGQIGQHDVYRPLGPHVRPGPGSRLRVRRLGLQRRLPRRKRGPAGVGDREGPSRRPPARSGATAPRTASASRHRSRVQAPVRSRSIPCSDDEQHRRRGHPGDWQSRLPCRAPADDARVGVHPDPERGDPAVRRVPGLDPSHELPCRRHCRRARERARQLDRVVGGLLGRAARSSSATGGSYMSRPNASRRASAGSPSAAS